MSSEVQGKVLLVDDQEIVLDTYEHALNELGYQIDMATSGQDALTKLAENHYHLVMLDIQLPDISGYEVAKQMRELEANKETAIIFASAVYDDEYHIFMGYESGAVDFLLKPVNLKVLLHKVKTLVNLAALNEQRLDAMKLQFEKQQLAESKAHLETMQKLQQERDELLNQVISFASQTSELSNSKNKIMHKVRDVLAQNESAGASPEEMVQNYKNVIAELHKLIC